MTHHITDEQIVAEAARNLGECVVENCGLGDIKDFARAVLALAAPQSESEARRAAQEQLYAERERHTAEVKRLQAEIGRLQSLRPQGEPKLIGWRTENFLWETDDVDKARNWEPNIGVLPIFEGDPNTKLGSRGITAPAGGEG